MRPAIAHIEAAGRALAPSSLVRRQLPLEVAGQIVGCDPCPACSKHRRPSSAEMQGPLLVPGHRQGRRVVRVDPRMRVGQLDVTAVESLRRRRLPDRVAERVARRPSCECGHVHPNRCFWCEENWDEAEPWPHEAFWAGEGCGWRAVCLGCVEWKPVPCRTCRQPHTPRCVICEHALGNSHRVIKFADRTTDAYCVGCASLFPC